MRWLFQIGVLVVALFASYCLTLAQERQPRLAPHDTTDQIVPPVVKVAIPDFSSAVQANARAVAYVGHPKGGSGTAFVISRKHRLLVTAAHVADIQAKYGSLYVVLNESKMGFESTKGPCYRVNNVWYHASLARLRPDGGTVWGNLGPSEGPVHHPCPDVAIMQLNGQEEEPLPAEFTLAGKGPGALLARPIGMLAFPGQKFPFKFPDTKEYLIATFQQGVVSRTMGYGQAPGHLFLETSLQARLGQSGAPIFLSDGRVIAVNSHTVEARTREEGGVEILTRLSFAVHADCIWQCIEKYPELRRYFGLSGPRPQTPAAKR